VWTWDKISLPWLPAPYVINYVSTKMFWFLKKKKLGGFTGVFGAKTPSILTKYIGGHYVSKTLSFCGLIIGSIYD
jgi:hypothetical protein